MRHECDCRPAHQGLVDRKSRECRAHEGGQIDVVETDQRDVRRKAEPCVMRLPHGRKRRPVIGAEHCRYARIALQVAEGLDRRRLLKNVADVDEVSRQTGRLDGAASSGPVARTLPQ